MSTDPVIRFELDGAHPAHAAKIEAIITLLQHQFPWVPLRRVGLYQPDEDDRSLGNADQPGEIRLNAYWFTQPPDVLQRAAIEGVLVSMGGTVVPWHRAIREPEHVIIHEFWHTAAQAKPEWEKAAKRRWAATTKRPQFGPSGYGVAAGPAESLAEDLTNYALELTTDAENTWIEALLGTDAAALDDFQESEHPRGQAGKFVKKGEGGGAVPAHIAKLRIPPAWTDVHYNSDPKGDLLVTGKDAKGRVQRIYSERFAKTQAAAKFARIKALERRCAAIWKRNDSARRSRDPAIRDSADVLALIISTGIRPGSDAETGGEVKAYGATTLEGRHVVKDGDQVNLRFVGKKGVPLDIPVANPEIAKMLVDRAKTVGADAKLFPETDAGRVLRHVKNVGGGNLKTKDFRTFLGTRTAIEAVQNAPVPKTPSAYKRAVREVAAIVAKKLGNTPTVALQSYISPVVFGDWRMASGAD